MSEKFPRKLVLDSVMENVEQAAYFAEKAARDMHFSDGDIDDIAIALTEAVSNAMIHGNKNDARKKIVIEISQKSDRMIMTVLDEGKGFDPNYVDNPLLPENLLKENGRGIFILKSLMDKIDYSSSNYNTQIKLVKYKTPKKKDKK